MFVVANVLDVQQFCLWNAVLCGGVICAADFIVSQTGPCLVFEAAVESHRIVWFTDAFITAHGRIAEVTSHRTGLVEYLLAF